MSKYITKNEVDNNLMKIRLVVLRCIAEVWKSDNEIFSGKLSNEKYFKEGPAGNDREGHEYPINPTSNSISAALCGVKKMIDKEKDVNSDVKKSFEIIHTYFNILYDQGKPIVSSDIKQLIIGMVELGWLRCFIEYCDPYALNAVFGSAFGYSLPYVNFGIQIIKPTAVWNFYGDNEWVKPKTEAMYISLPDLPDSDTDDALKPYQNANMLMKYYEAFPSFFGAQVYDNCISGQVNPELVIKPMGESHLTRKPVVLDTSNSSAGNDYDLGVNEDAFLSFSSVLNKLIAVLWQNDMFKEKLDYPLGLKRQTDVLKVPEDEPPMEFNSIYDFSFYLNSLENKVLKTQLEEFDEAYDRELISILKEHFSYESPWIFKIRFIMADSCVFWKDNNDSIKVDDIVNLTTIEIPNAPTDRETSNVSMALARYNATGPAYPFTCS